MSSRSSQYVEVQLEIGHRATPKTKLTPEGHTHDWTVFVRGPESSHIEHFVEKVVFHLHESFPRHKRVLKEPPYEVSESGYASFELPVEVYFKNKEEPKKICFDYDLYLRLDDAVSNTRREKLTFQNPSNDFKKKLLKAGGVTNESSAATIKSTTNCDDRQNTTNTNTTNTSASNNTTKYTKASISGNESKRSKALGVIPSKALSLNNTQNSTTSSSSTPLFVPEKNPICTTNTKQFTELFGTPIQARPSSDSSIGKNKETSSKIKSTPIASKGVKNESKSSHKSSFKNSYSSPSHKVIENKTGKETKESNKSTNKSKESTKTKHDEEEVVAKQKKKSLLSPTPHETIDKKTSDFKGSKKRRTSTSSNSSSLTCGSFGGSGESKSHKDPSPKISSNKDHDNKKESKKQKISSKDMNSGVKKQSSTSTKISFSNNNSSTTIEIKSVKKEKTWDKKSKSKEFKSSEFKSAKENLNSNNGNNASQNTTKTKVKGESSCLKSPKFNSNKNLKVTKDKYISTHRETSSSPSSCISESLTPGRVALSSSSSIHGPIGSIMADMDSHESMSPLLSSDTTTTPIRFDRSNNEINNNINQRLISDDSDSDDSIKPNKHSNQKSHSKEIPLSSSKSQKETPKLNQTNKRKRDSSKEVNKLSDQSKSESRIESSLSPAHETCLNFQSLDSVVVNDLIDIQKRISESTNTDLLQKIVDTIEESGLYNITNTTFDFDLMKLDKTTIRKLKTFLS